VITGVSGSGKSTLLKQTLKPAAETMGAYGPLTGFSLSPGRPISAVKMVDQEPMGRTPRSTPMTYLDAYTPIRNIFAALEMSARMGLTASHFSFNTKGGRCDNCDGAGYEKLEMLFFEDMYVPCRVCDGKRFKPEVLAVRYKGLNIHDVMGLTVDEALEVFAHVKKVERPLSLMQQMGLGYLVLGQPANTLSGGEAQRLKIASELTGRKPRDVLYLLDEPTTGLHVSDTARLVKVLDTLVEAGNTVVVVEHDPDFVMCADWVIDLGPGGGVDGGRVVDTGPPAAVAKRGLGPTGRYLAKLMNEE